MVYFDGFGLVAGAILLGAVHGIEPGHGWPVAAAYALDQTNKWLYGFAASLILGVGHLISSIAMVAAFFYAKAYLNLTQVDTPIEVLDGVTLGGPVSIVAGILLIALGIREYRNGRSHATHDHAHGASQPDHTHSHETLDEQSHGQDKRDTGPHDDSEGSFLSRLRGVLPSSGGHPHARDTHPTAGDRGLFGIAWFAFVLGFAHEEEFEIIALCAGSEYCLELMSAYALTVILGIVGLTMLLIAGYQHAEKWIERYTPYLPAFSAAVLIIMGLGFITGLF